LIIYFLILVILISLILIWYIYTLGEFNKKKAQIAEADAELDSVLRKKFDLLNRSITIIKGNTSDSKDVLENIIKLRSRKLSNFEFDKELDDSINEFNNIKNVYPDLDKIESFKKVDRSIKEIDEQLLGIKKYYNDICTTFNHMIRTFPSKLIALIPRLKPYVLFDIYDNNKMDNILK
jgi:LemA protein